MYKQELSQKLLQKLSPQQIQLMKLVQLPTLAFEQRILEELEDNPALEDNSTEVVPEEDFNDQENNYEDDYKEDIKSIDSLDLNIDDYISNDEIPQYKTQTNNYSEDDETYETPFIHVVSFHEYLIEQLHSYSLDEQELLCADFIIGNLDDNGYLRRDLNLIIDDLAFNTGIYVEYSVLENILLRYIQKLEPAGVGARNLSECLIIQLKEKIINNKSNKNILLAIQIIEFFFDLFIKKHYDKIIFKLSITQEDLKSAIKEIERLNPKPGKSFIDNYKNTEQITPDFIVTVIDDNELELSLNRRNAPELKVSRTYTNMLETYRDTEHRTREQKEATFFIKQKLDSAKWFIDAVKQRQNTLYSTMFAILEYQKEYFLTGEDEYLKPMILKDIAEKIQMDISTVSRVVNSKYVSTPFGTFLIKKIFSESLTNDEGEEVSTREIKKILQNVIFSEDKQKPLTDDKLMKILKEKGYNIARRTIAKYREQLNIPVARLRKELN